VLEKLFSSLKKGTNGHSASRKRDISDEQRQVGQSVFGYLLQEAIADLALATVTVCAEQH
jgi:hypothetical protein